MTLEKVNNLTRLLLTDVVKQKKAKLYYLNRTNLSTLKHKAIPYSNSGLQDKQQQSIKK